MLYSSITACPFLFLAGDSRGPPARASAGMELASIVENISICISVMLLHYICSKIHLCFLATLKNIAPEYFLPHSCSFYFSNRRHCISFHKAPWSGKWIKRMTLLNVGFFPLPGLLFFPPVLCGKIKQVKVSALSEMRTALGLSVGIMQHGYRCTTIED